MHRVMVVGAGPAGLMAAQVLSEAGVAVEVFDAMPSVGRKFLLAGKGGLNLTHAEPFNAFVSRYAPRQREVGDWLSEFGAHEVRAWATSLGVETFVGSTARVFPVDMKAAPLLRAWLHRLRQPKGGTAVKFFMRHRWGGALSATPGCVNIDFATPTGVRQRQADAVVLALPMYNFTIPSTFKAWMDRVARAGVTFRYTETGPEGLLESRPVYVFCARGGQYLGTANDTQTRLIEMFFGLIGLSAIHFTYAEGLAYGEAAAAAALEQAQARVAALPLAA